MAKRSAPVPAGVGTDLRQVKAYVPLQKWQDVMDRAELAGMSVSAYLNALIDRDQLDESGRPVWVEQTSQDQEELPLSKAS
jgi:hypothetical protein